MRLERFPARCDRGYDEEDQRNVVHALVVSTNVDR